MENKEEENKEIEEKPVYKQLKRGACIHYEEGGVTLNNKLWQNKFVKAISYVLQTFRYRGIILIFTLPYIDFLDMNTRKMLDASWETITIDRVNNKVHLRPKLLNWSSKKQKFYERFLRVSGTGRKKAIKIDNWGVPKPSAKLWSDYEKKKDKFINKLYGDIMQDIRSDKKIVEKVVEEKELTLKQAETIKLMNIHHNTEKVAGILGLTVGSVYEQLRWAKKKGYIPNKPL